MPPGEALPPPDAWPPPPAEAPGGFVPGPASESERAAVLALLANDYPPIDPVALAESLGGVPGPIPRVVADAPAGWQEGDLRDFWVLNNDTIEYSAVPMELLAVGEHAYLWFDREARSVSAAAARRAAADFDDIYGRVRAIFGAEPNPGIDGDPRVYILHTVSNRMGRGVAGYLDDTSQLPQAAFPHSNEHELFVMNLDYLTPGSSDYASTLAHEFQHLIHGAYDHSDTDWVVEGSAVYAEDALGYTAGPAGMAAAYLSSPDRPLNQGVDVVDYGYGFLFVRYVAERLGQPFLRDWLQRPEDGLVGLEAALVEAGLDVTAFEVFDGFLAANLIGGDPQAPPEYRHPGLRFTPVQPALPSRSGQNTVHQYVADYYRLGGGQRVEFRGSARVRPIPAAPHSGEYYWWSGRANMSDLTLTRAFDLTGVPAATLNYRAWFDIEEGWDYAYVVVSTDGGRTWQGLETPHMSDYDPQKKTYTERFYTGSSGGAWVEETADLTPFAGGEILLRFQYLTDPILTLSGLAIDDLSIPEIGFYDDAETEGGWQAAGWNRVTAYLPQEWRLQLVTYPGGAPQVAPVILDADLSAAFDVPPGEAVLIVSGLAPFTLEPAVYELRVE